MREKKSVVEVASGTLPPLLGLITTLLLLDYFGSVLNTYVAQWDLSRRYVDDASYVEFVLHRFHPSGQALVLLGGSVTREGVPDDLHLAELLQTAVAVPVDVRNLAYSSFSPIEAVAIVDTLDAPRGTVVALQLSWQNLVESGRDLDALVRRPRIAHLDWTSVLDSASLGTRLEVALTPSLIRNSAVIANYLDQRDCDWLNLLAQAEREVCLRPMIAQRNFYSVESRQLESEKQASVAIAHAELRPLVQQNHQFAEAVYARFIERSVTRGFHPVLMMFPRDPTETMAIAAHQLDVIERGAMKRLSELTEVIDLRDVDGLLAEDFADPLHLLESGRAKISVLVADRIGDIIEQTGRRSST